VGVSIDNRKEEKRIQEATARNVQGERRNGDEVRREGAREASARTTPHTPKLAQVKN